jgi:hypothetical protein
MFIYFILELIRAIKADFAWFISSYRGIPCLAQVISTFPFLQNPSGQHTISFPLSACRPNSCSEIGDLVSGEK